MITDDNKTVSQKAIERNRKKSHWKRQKQENYLFFPLTLVSQDVPELLHSSGARIEDLEELLAISHRKLLSSQEKDAQRTDVCPLRPPGLLPGDMKNQRVLDPDLWQPECRDGIQVSIIWD